MKPAGMGGALLVVIFPGLLLGQDIFDHPEFGLRFSYRKEDYVLRTKAKEFRFGWRGTVCEVESRSGVVRGALTIWPFTGGILVKPWSAGWERDILAKRKGVRDVRRMKDEPLPGRRGDWMRTEFGWEEAGRPIRALALFAARGNKNIVFILEVPAVRWLQYRDALRKIADGLEVRKVWRCQNCVKIVTPAMKQCKGCGTAIWPADPVLAQFSREHEIQIGTQPSKEYLVQIGVGKDRKLFPASPEDLEKGSQRIAAELLKYPREFFRRFDIELICIVEKMSKKGMDPKKARLAGFYTLQFATLFTTLPPEFDLEMEERATIHHEFFHGIDHKDDGVLGDGKWQASNPWGFEYDPSVGVGFALSKGVTSRYGQHMMGEDRAEAYAWLIVHHAKRGDKAKKDPFLRKKLKLIKAMIAAYCPQMDEKWWESLEEKKE